MRKLALAPLLGGLFVPAARPATIKKQMDFNTDGVLPIAEPNIRC